MAPCDQGPHDGAPAGSGGGPALIVGATGYIGRFVAEACLASGRKTCILVRPGNACPARAAAVDALRQKGAVVIEGRVNGTGSVEATLRAHGIEMVISVMGGANILDQLRLIDAIRTAGTVKRFLPSEFGHDVDRAQPVGAGLGFYEEKRQVRRATEASGVPYTYICCNSIAGWPYFDNTHPSEVPPPLDRFQIYGDGTVKAFFVAGSDIGKFTIKAAYDPRGANKAVHFRPACNLLSTNEMASLWECKIGRTLPRVTLSEDDLLAMAADNIIPASIVASLTHDIFINGCQTSFPIDGCRDIEISSLYPDIPFRTIDECFDDYAKGLRLEGEAEGNKNVNVPTVERLEVPPSCAYELQTSEAWKAGA
ncbi:leucoanthocyanidin reductase-like [Phragmites australis]|uniref:leucoanthocyanidin reductase-like n=1 Tax=Phragmites australis TaxID=29695 RepID=UPI002D793FC7|nr:leucoanthocyanidin reductase-like [Phragmites australis]